MWSTPNNSASSASAWYESSYSNASNSSPSLFSVRESVYRHHHFALISINAICWKQRELIQGTQYILSWLFNKHRIEFTATMTKEITFYIEILHFWSKDFIVLISLKWFKMYLLFFVRFSDFKIQTNAWVNNMINF